MTIHNDFHHAQYDKVLEFNTSSVSTEAATPARILQLRAKIALGQTDKVLSETKGDASKPEIAAVRALATYKSGKEDAAVAEAEKLAESSSEVPYVQVIAGTILAAAGKTEEALALLQKHQGSLEAVAVIVQIHLSQNRLDLASKEVQSARKWAQDSLLINITESWVGLRLGGDRYQQAFYEFEEMPVPQAIAELHLGRLPEAEAALQRQLAESEGDVDALANSVVLNTLSAKDTSDLMKSLQKASPNHPLLVDMKEKSDLFDQAASKFAAKVAA